MRFITIRDHWRKYADSCEYAIYTRPNMMDYLRLGTYDHG